jgi:hypothetical protein
MTPLIALIPSFDVPIYIKLKEVGLSMDDSEA